MGLKVNTKVLVMVSCSSNKGILTVFGELLMMWMYFLNFKVLIKVNVRHHFKNIETCVLSLLVNRNKN